MTRSLICTSVHMQANRRLSRLGPYGLKEIAIIGSMHTHFQASAEYN